VGSYPFRLDAQSSSQLVGRAVVAGEQAGDRQPFGVGQRTKDVVGALGHVGGSA